MKITRNGSELIDVQVNNQTRFMHILGGKKYIKSSFVLKEYTQLQIGDYVNWRGEQFMIYSEPAVNKLKTNEFRYDVEFQSGEHKLLNALYLFDNQGEFYLLGNLEKFANLIVENLNRIAGAGAYELEAVPDTEVKNLNFSNMNCLNALQYLATEFDVEYSIYSTGPIKIKIEDKIGNETGLTFEYKYGLRNITRKKIANADLVTRLYPYGGERNITHDYGNKRLRLTPLFLENNVNLFGTIEGVVNFDEIYPRRLGTLSGVDSDELKFTDSAIDFNVNDQLISGGVRAKITFNSGSLEGYEFELQSFNNTSKQFTLISFEDENGLVLPDPTLKPAVGDTYVLHDITMPQSYITNAETELQTKAQEYLNENSTPNIIYAVEPDHIYLRQHLIELSVGDIIQVQDKDLEADFDTRILEVSQSIADPYLYTFKIGTKVSVGYVTRSLSDQLDAKNKIEIEQFERILQYNRNRKGLKKAGAMIVYRGLFDVAELYYNNAYRRDAVKYNNAFYLYQGTDGVALQWSASNWEEFGAQFDSVATNLLLAEEANIADWVIKNGKITSQEEATADVPRMILDGQNGVIKMNGINESGYRGRSELRDEGLFIEGEGLEIDGQYESYPYYTGIVNVLKRGLYDDFAVQMLAAFYGKAENTTAKGSKVYGGYFHNLFAKGFNLEVENNSATGNYIIGSGGSIESMYFVGSYSATLNSIEFPQAPLRNDGANYREIDHGKLVFVFNQGTLNYGVIIKPNNITNLTSNYTLPRYGLAIFYNYHGSWFKIL